MAAELSRSVQRRGILTQALIAALGVIASIFTAALFAMDQRITELDARLARAEARAQHHTHPPRRWTYPAYDPNP